MDTGSFPHSVCDGTRLLDQNILHELRAIRKPPHTRSNASLHRVRVKWRMLRSPIATSALELLEFGVPKMIDASIRTLKWPIRFVMCAFVIPLISMLRTKFDFNQRCTGSPARPIKYTDYCPPNVFRLQCCVLARNPLFHQLILGHLKEAKVYFVHNRMMWSVWTYA